MNVNVQKRLVLKLNIVKTTFLDIFYHARTLMQRTEFIINSKALNLNAGLNRVVRIQPLPIIVLLFLPPNSVKGGLDSIIWAAISYV